MEGVVRRIALDLDVENIAKAAKAAKDSKMAEVGADIELIIKQTWLETTKSRQNEDNAKWLNEIWVTAGLIQDLSNESDNYPKKLWYEKGNITSMRDPLGQQIIHYVKTSLYF